LYHEPPNNLTDCLKSYSQPIKDSIIKIANGGGQNNAQIMPEHLIRNIDHIDILFQSPPEKNNAISLHIGKPYEDVLRDSTFPVKSNTAMRQTTPLVEDSTWITSPVIVKFDDPQHGFTLPPTKFGAIGYNNGRVTTLTTSPMLEACLSTN
jgi:hypothetical protein